MRFDLTGEVALDRKNLKLYRILQIALYLSAFLLAIYLAFIILFPSAAFSFDFTNPNSKNNTIANPRDAMQSPINNGDMLSGNKYYFDTAVSGLFSKAVINFSLNNKSQKLSSGSIEIKKSYQAFLYPESAAVGFKDGTLLTDKNNYFIVSNGELRKFATPSIFNSLGFPQNAFIAVAPEELSYNPIGQLIADNSSYPDDSLFKINDNYYILQNKTLEQFTSATAFLDQYKSAQAIEKDNDFLSKYAVSENSIGFADGALISYGISVYIVSGNSIFPINNPVTFVAKGFSWNDVIPASADEISLYTRAKLFNITSAHPDGTIFKTVEDSKYYLIEKGKKHFLPSENIAASWLGRSPIMVSEKSLNATSSCTIKKDALGFGSSYSCEIPVSSLQQLDGTDYEFSMNVNNAVKINSVSVTFEKDINNTNFHSSLRGLFNQVINNYVPATPTATTAQIQQ